MKEDYDKLKIEFIEYKLLMIFQDSLKTLDQNNPMKSLEVKLEVSHGNIPEVDLARISCYNRGLHGSSNMSRNPGGHAGPPMKMVDNATGVVPAGFDRVKGIIYQK